MEAFDAYLNSLMNKNRLEFSDFSEIKWLNYYVDNDLIQKRNQLVLKVEDKLFKQTKPYYNHISKGCQLCGKGLWSCLFITNKCNANCFYCPAAQNIDETPSTQSMEFLTAELYADYVKTFGFKGVSFSGGEPLLFFDRTLDYLKAVRRIASPDVYIWLYTNGILADYEKLKILADNGLNEIRFDIGATNYNIEKLKIATQLLPVVTVEIPAVPEKTDLLNELLYDLDKIGVKNLNLHQLRLTKYNAPQLLKRNYTYVNAERPIVLESEISALETLLYAKERDLQIGINYCSFHYKNRFQKAGFRKILAKLAGNDETMITENGFVRKLQANELYYLTYKISNERTDNSIELKSDIARYYLKEENVGLKLSLNEKIDTVQKSV